VPLLALVPGVMSDRTTGKTVWVIPATDSREDAQTSGLALKNCQELENYHVNK